MIVLIFTASGRFPRGVRQASSKQGFCGVSAAALPPQAGVAALRSKQRNLQKSTLNETQPISIKKG